MLEPTSSLEQAILAVHPSTTEVDRFPSVSPTTTLAMAAIDTTLLAFTGAWEPTPSIHSSPSPVLNTGLPPPLVEAPISGDNLAAPSLSSSLPTASWVGHAEKACATNFPTSSDLDASVFTSVASPGLHDTLSQSQGGNVDMDMGEHGSINLPSIASWEGRVEAAQIANFQSNSALEVGASQGLSDAGADLLVCRHLFHGEGQDHVRDDSPFFVAPPPSQGTLDHIASWQESISLHGESATMKAMYATADEIVALCRGYSDYFIDKSLALLMGSVLGDMSDGRFDSMTSFVTTALSMGPRLQDECDQGDNFVALKNSSWYWVALGVIAAILQGCVRTPDVRLWGMFVLEPEDGCEVDLALCQPASMLEALQFMTGQLMELLLPDAHSLPKVSVNQICSQIWELHETALRAKMEECFSRLRDRMDFDCFQKVIDSVLANLSSSALADLVSEALMEQLTEQLRLQLGQHFAQAPAT